MYYYTPILQPLGAVCAYSAKDSAKALKQNGYTVISMLGDADVRAAQRRSFVEAMQGFREYQRHPDDASRTPSGHPIVYVAGGYGALGNPSSFHCEHAREIRECIFAGAMPLLSASAALGPIWGIKKGEEPRVSVFMERNSIRGAGTVVGADSFHRDHSPDGVLSEGDEAFGCILNPNDYAIVSN